MKPKILLIQPSYAHYRNELFNSLAERVDLVVLYVNRKRDYPGDFLPGNYAYEFTDLPRPLLAWALLKAFRRHKPQAIISSISLSAQTHAAFPLARLLGIPFVLWIEEWIKPSYSGIGLSTQLKRIRALIARYILRHADAVVALGTATSNYAIKILEIPEMRVHRGGIQCSSDLQTTALPEPPKSTDSVRFLFLGRLIELKAPDLLIQAFAKLQQEFENVTLRIAGSGPMLQPCIDLALRLKLSNVEFCGEVEPQQVSSLMQSADIFVLPSRRINNRHEGWGLSINEAMSMSLPILSTNAVGATFDLVHQNVNGIVVEENSVAALHSGMASILQLDLDELGTASRRLFQEKNNISRAVNSFHTAIIATQRS